MLKKKDVMLYDVFDFRYMKYLLVRVRCNRVDFRIKLTHIRYHEDL